MKRILSLISVPLVLHLWPHPGPLDDNGGHYHEMNNRYHRHKMSLTAKLTVAGIGLAVGGLLIYDRKRRKFKKDKER